MLVMQIMLRSGGRGTGLAALLADPGTLDVGAKNRVLGFLAEGPEA